MLRIILLFVGGLFSILSAIAQEEFVLTQPGASDYNRVSLTFSSTYSTCFIGPTTDTSSSILFYNNDYKESFRNQSKFHYEENTQFIQVDLSKENSSLISSSFSGNIFGKNTNKNFDYFLRLSNDKPLMLNLNYAIGDAEVDLSDLPVERLKIKTGSANVNLNYDQGSPNKLLMDTLYVKVDMGTFTTTNLHLSKANVILTDIGFGRAFLDFSNIPDKACDVRASVGAGSLEIVLPDSEIPVVIQLNDSPLCKVRLPEAYRKIDKNTYTNYDAESNPEEMLQFSVDVALGNITFSTK